MSKDAFKKFSYVLVGRTFVTISQALFFIILAAFLEPTQYGELSYLASIAGTASIVARFGFPNTVVVYQSKGKIIQANQLNILAIITAVLASVILLTVNIYVALLTLTLSLFIMNQQNFIGLQKFREYLRVSIIRGVILISLPIILYFVLDLPGILLGMSIGYLIGGFDFLKKIKVHSKVFTECKIDFKLLTNNFGVIAASGLPKWIDKLIIAPIFGFAYLGFYQFDLQIFYMLSVLPNSLGLFLLSEESRGKNNPIISYFVLILASLSKHQLMKSFYHNHPFQIHLFQIP